MFEFSSTFSIVAPRSSEKLLGVGVATAAPGVGSRVPHVEAEVGAIATQAYTDVTYGIEGLSLLKMGIEPQKALRMMLERDPNSELRQVIIIDPRGRKAAFTGKRVPAWKGHFIGRDFVVAGNFLSGGKVVESMVRAFEESGGEPLAERLMRCLEAGQEAGGDRRGVSSAALIVAGPNSTLKLTVDEHAHPLKELRRQLRNYSVKSVQKG